MKIQDLIHQSYGFTSVKQSNNDIFLYNCLMMTRKG